MKNLIKPNGKFLYKYSGETGIDYLESILLKNELYFPRPSELNDPAEGRPKLSGVTKDSLISFLYKSYISNNPGLSEKEQSFHLNQIKHTVNEYGVDRLHIIMSEIIYEELGKKNHRIYSCRSYAVGCGKQQNGLFK